MATLDMAARDSAAVAPARPGLAAGRWIIDVAHSTISFTVRHLMVSKVRGRFGHFEGLVDIAEETAESSVAVTIDMSSVDTGNHDRDAHLRSSDFFDVARYPTMTYRSLGVRPVADGYELSGELTAHGVTRPVVLALQFEGAYADLCGCTRARFFATTQISRRDFGIDISMELEGGGVVAGDKVKVFLEIEAVLQAARAGRAPSR